jgi:hypothetical protein
VQLPEEEVTAKDGPLAVGRSIDILANNRRGIARRCRGLVPCGKEEIKGGSEVGVDAGAGGLMLRGADLYHPDRSVVLSQDLRGPLQHGVFSPLYIHKNQRPLARQPA